MIPLIDSKEIENLAERDCYEALMKLPESYTVIHSFRWSNPRSHFKLKRNGEADFVVVHPNKGFIVIEVKAGHISYKDGSFYYQNGMNTNPMQQADDSMFFIRERLKESTKGVLPNSFSACWFPDISRNVLNIKLPSDFFTEAIFTKETLTNTESFLDRLYSTNKQTISISNDLFISTIAPDFNLVMSVSNLIDKNNRILHMLTMEQSRLLDYIEEQESAVIHGAAGTGKTMIAIEKAKRIAEKGERVLFLCYNSLLKNHLDNLSVHPNISFENVHSLAAKIISSANVSESDLLDLLSGKTSKNFDYDSVIIDEAQDIQSELVDLLSTLIRSHFYVFYDKNQLIQKETIPYWIASADCKLILSRNCRNTIRIAKTSSIPINVEPKLNERAFEGEKPYLFVEDQESVIRRIELLIDDLVNKEGVSLSDITVLTLKTEDKSIINQSQKLKSLSQSSNPRGFLFTSTRKFKGLESEIVIVVDLDKESLESDLTKRMLYVAASRAKNLLYIFCIADSDDANAIAFAINGTPKTRKGKYALSRALEAQNLD